MKIYKSREFDEKCAKVKERLEEGGVGGWGGVRCLWMLSVSQVIYHQDRYRYGVLASQPHYTFRLLLKHSHTHFH